ncbi:hypothetical protein Tco_1524161 [Tanacetum coccineum]
MRKQLETDAMWFYFDAFLTSVKPKNFKEAMLESSWIEAMQEEIQEFERLQVWELVDLQGQPIACVQAQKGPLRSQTGTTCMVRHAVKLLISQHFSKGAVDPTLFIRKAENDLLLITRGVRILDAEHHDALNS